MLKKRLRVNVASDENKGTILNKFQAFAGSGTRLDGKAKSQEQDVAEAQLNSEQRAQKLQKRGIPDFNYEIGSIRFIRAPLSKKSNTTDDTEKGGGGSSGGFKAFGGKGATIRNN